MAERPTGNQRRARGGIFAAELLAPYIPKGTLVGQLTPDSCVAGISRMLLLDLVKDVPEAHLRVALQTDRAGTDLHKLPAVLEQFGLPVRLRGARGLELGRINKANNCRPRCCDREG